MWSWGKKSVSVCVSWRHGISLCPGSDCQRECSWCLIRTKTRLYWGHRCVCIFVCFTCSLSLLPSLSHSLIPPHIQTLDVDSPLFVQCIHCGSNYGSRLNSSLSTSSDLLSLPFLLSLSPGVSLPLLFFFSSFLLSSPWFSIRLCSARTPLISSFPSWVVIIPCSLAGVYHWPRTGQYRVTVYSQLTAINAWIFVIISCSTYYTAAQLKKNGHLKVTMACILRVSLLFHLICFLLKHC